MGKKFFRTVIVTEVLSENAPVDDASLSDIASDAVGGDLSAQRVRATVTELTPGQMATALLQQGSDPEFFGLGDAEPQQPPKMMEREAAMQTLLQRISMKLESAVFLGFKGALNASALDALSALGAEALAAAADAQEPGEKAQTNKDGLDKAPFVGEYSIWRHGGWYVNNIRYPSGAVGCVSNNYPDSLWRIVCDPRRTELGQPGDHTFATRGAAAAAEFELVLAMSVKG
jgi:hypothetical protein